VGLAHRGRSDCGRSGGTLTNLRKVRRNIGLAAVTACLLILLSASAAHRAPQASGSAASATALVLNIDPSQSQVHYSVSSSLHTVHGTFAVKRGNLQIDSGSDQASGEIIVDAASGKSGSDSRDKKMHKEVLESARFAEITFRPDHLDGALQRQGASNAKLHGVFVLHGIEHEITVPVHAELTADHWKGKGEFSVPYNDWGLKNPGNFFLKVDHAVTIEVEIAGTVQAQAASAKP
jgi:polyisoprenoid-binding protein YceI